MRGDGPGTAYVSGPCPRAPADSLPHERCHQISSSAERSKMIERPARSARDQPIEACEAEHYPMDPPDPIEAVEFSIARQGVTRSEPLRQYGEYCTSVMRRATSTGEAKAVKRKMACPRCIDVSRCLSERAD